MKKFANGFARLLFGLCVVMASPAWALGDNPLPPSLNPKCAGITLTGEKFLDMFHAIAMHGDLTDVPFIEKTLETKFEMKHYNLESKSFPYKRVVYKAQSILGAPIMVEFKFDIESDPRIQNKFIAIMHFSSNIYDCIGLTEEDVKRKFGFAFGTNFPITHDADGMPTEPKDMMGSKRLRGKDGSTIHVVYLTGRKETDKFIKGFTIRQNK